MALQLLQTPSLQSEKRTASLAIWSKLCSAAPLANGTAAAANTELAIREANSLISLSKSPLILF